MLRIVFAILLGAFASQAADQPVTWKRWELTMDQWSSGVDVTFSGPGGHRIQVPAFASGGVLRARVAFPKAGVWTWAATAAGKSRKGRIHVAPYKGTNPLYRHGFLRVSSNGRYLEHADGTPFLWMGDTPWFALTRATDAEWRDYLDLRARGNFSVIQVSALGTWPRLLPASVPIPKPFDEAGSPEAAHWDRIDARVREANERGLAVLMVGLARPPLKADLDNVRRPGYAREVAARFFGDHVMFSPNFDQAYQQLFDEVAERLRAHTSLHLITQHPNTQNGQDDLYVPKAYLSSSGMQSGHHEGKLDRVYTAAREWPIRLRALEPAKPVINIEAMYDGRGNDEGAAWRQQDARKLGWISWLSGALGYTYGAGETARKVPGASGGMWGFNQDSDAWDYWRKVAVLPSARQMTVLSDFLRSIEWWRLEPAGDRIQSDAASPEARPLMAVADNRGFGVAYTPAGAAMHIDLSVFIGPVQPLWLNPITGDRTTVPGNLANHGAYKFAPPKGEHDWVLLLKAR